MNATKYYVSTCRLVIQAHTDSTWQDLCRILPMLRNSLSCTVCENLLIEPYTPEETSCEHHVCKSCRGGAKAIRPTCSWCKDYSKYFENVQLRILIQSYKKLCAFIKITKMYDHFSKSKENGQEIRDIIRESEGDLNTATAFSHGPPREEEEQSQPQCQPRIPVSSIKEEVSERPEVFVPLRSPPPVGRQTGSREPPDEIISSPLARPPPASTSPAGPVRVCRLEDRLRESNTALEETPLVLLVPEREMEEEEEVTLPAATTTTTTAAAAIKTEFIPLTPSNTPQYSVSRGETPSPPNAQRYSSAGQDGGGLARRLSPGPWNSAAVPAGAPFNNIRLKDETSSPVLVHSLESGSKEGEEGRRSSTSWIALSGFPATSSRLSQHGRSAPGILSSPGGSRRPMTLSNLLKTSSSSAAQPVQPSADTRTSLAPGRPSFPDKGKGKKKLPSGCRCGNATQFPGKLTCCGQRCPCYVDRLACLDCRCRGCNNPNLPGGGKLLPFADLALTVNPKSAASRLPPAPSDTTVADTINETADVKDVPMANVSSTSSSSISPYKSGQTSSSFNQVLHISSPSSAFSKVTLVPSSYSSFAKVPASTLNTLAVPLASLTNSGFKIRPADQLQRREIKARVIPTTYRLEAMPYARATILNKRSPLASGIRLKHVSLVSVVGGTNDKAGQKPKEEVECNHIDV